MEILKGMKLCLYGGSVMPDEVGDKLVEQGVRLVGHIGSTEMGQVRASFQNSGSRRVSSSLTSFALSPSDHDFLPRLRHRQSLELLPNPWTSSRQGRRQVHRLRVRRRIGSGRAIRVRRQERLADDGEFTFLRNRCCNESSLRI